MSKRIRLMVGKALVFLALTARFLPFTCAAVPLDPRGAGLGGAYTAVVSGPLAGLRNPAGIVDSPGVHGAVGALRSDTDDFVLGVSVATGEGPAVAWASGGGMIQGGLAFYALPELKLGLGISYRTGPGVARGVSLVLGGEYRIPSVRFGMSLHNLGSGIFGVGDPVFGYIGAAIEAVPGITVVGDLKLSPTGSEVAIGGEASLWRVRFRWGVAVHLAGGFIRAGLGVGGELFGIGMDLAGGLAGPEHHPFFSLGISAGIPAWW